MSSTMAPEEAEKKDEQEVINPFLKHTGKEISLVECPKGHGLKLFVSPLGKPCAVCGKQMPNGDRAWRCFPCDFHICIDCHEKGGQYDRGTVQESEGYHNPNWDGKPMDPFGDITTRDVTTLRDLLSKYAESTRLLTVKCECVIPDYSNRGHTGLSVEHVHKVAQSMARGFRVRDLDDTEYQGYDIPVLVRETTQTEGGKDALKNWSGIVMETPGFPKPSVQLLRKSKESELFCSLGNGHFFQALNCFRTGVKSIWTQEGFARPDDHLSYVDSYVVPDEHGSNPMLRDAVLNGVPALVLKPDIPLKERVIICELLNKLSDYRWALKAGPSLATDPKDFVVDLDSLKEVDVKQSQFELLSKALDGLELNCLVRQETGQSGGDRVGN